MLLQCQIQLHRRNLDAAQVDNILTAPDDTIVLVVPFPLAFDHVAVVGITDPAKQPGLDVLEIAFEHRGDRDKLCLSRRDPGMAA